MGSNILDCILNIEKIGRVSWGDMYFFIVINEFFGYLVFLIYCVCYYFLL